MTSTIFGNLEEGPNLDVVSCLMDFLPNTELANLAGTSRLFHAFAQNELEKRFEAKYAYRCSTFETGDLAYPSEMARMINESPKVIKFAGSIVFRERNFGNARHRDSLRAVENKFYTFLTSYIEESPLLTATDKSLWSQRTRTFRVFHRHTLIALLAACPDTTKLYFCGDVAAICNDLNRMIRLIVDPPQTSPVNATVPVLKLVQLKLFASSSSGDHITAANLLHLASIPTLRDLRFFYVTIYQENHGSRAEMVETVAASNVEFLMFNRCHTAPEALALLIRQLPKLELFHMVGDSSFWDQQDVSFPINENAGAGRSNPYELRMDVQGFRRVCSKEAAKFIRELKYAARHTLTARNLILRYEATSQVDDYEDRIIVEAQERI